jgi:hypothetical protein
MTAGPVRAVIGAPEPVAAQAQVVGPDRAFEAGDPAHLAAPVA